MQSRNPHTVLKNGVPANLCGAQRKGEPEPCRLPRGECMRHCGSDLKNKLGERCPTPPMPNGKCRMHGGPTPRGLGLPQFDHGRYSVSIPSRLSQSYVEVMADARRLELDEELALIIVRNRELLSSLYSGESDGLWMRLRKHKRAMEAARKDGDADAQAEHFTALLRAIEAGAKDAERWDELVRNVETQRKLAESERKRRVEDHQIATTEEILAIMGAVLAIVTRHVRDERIRRAIGYDIEALVSGGESNGKAKPGEDDLTLQGRSKPV